MVQRSSKWKRAFVAAAAVASIFLRVADATTSSPPNARLTSSENSLQNMCPVPCDATADKDPCAEYSVVRVNLCSYARVATLRSLHELCHVLVIQSTLIMHGQKVDVLVADADSLQRNLPLCTRTRSDGTGSATPIENTNQILSPRLANVDVATQAVGQTSDKTFYDMYHVIEDMQSRWMSFVRRSNDVHIERIGKSVQGQDILMLRIGRTDKANPRRVFISALQHAREWAAGMTVTYMADQMSASLAADSGGDPASTEMRALLSTVEVLIVPIANPDGYNYTRRNRFHRKNMRQTSGSACFGVDLNRNWGVAYGSPFSTSTDLCDDVYVGTGAFSEPEVKALRDVISKTKGIRAHIDYHTYGGMILGPWAYSGSTPPMSLEWRAFGGKIANAIAAASGTKYRWGLGYDEILPYYAAGVMSDWTFNQGIMSATIEVRPVALAGENLGLGGFILDIDKLHECCNENYNGLRSVLQWTKTASLPGTPGDGSDAVDSSVENANNSTTPVPTTAGTPVVNAGNNQNSRSGVVGGGGWAGIAIAILLAVGVIAYLTLCFVRKRRQQPESNIVALELSPEDVA
jgi:Zinc carboxypeptidase